MPRYNVRVTIITEHCFTIEADTPEEARQLGEEHAWIESRDNESWTREERELLRSRERQVTYNERDETLEHIVVEEITHE